MSDFKAREIIIANESLWEKLEEFASEHNCELVCVFKGGEEELPEYVFSIKNLKETKL